MTWTIDVGDCRALLAGMEPESCTWMLTGTAPPLGADLAEASPRQRAGAANGRITRRRLVSDLAAISAPVDGPHTVNLTGALARM